jgi:hypothetical protein
MPGKGRFGRAHVSGTRDYRYFRIAEAREKREGFSDRIGLFPPADQSKSGTASVSIFPGVGLEPPDQPPNSAAGSLDDVLGGREALAGDLASAQARVDLLLQDTREGP